MGRDKKAVGAAVDWIVSAWEGMKEFFSNTWNGLVDGTKNAVNSVKEAWKGTKQWFADLWTGIKRHGSGYVGWCQAGV